MNSKTPARRALSTCAVGFTTVGLLALGVGTASAHVSVAPASTTENGYSQLTFSVPNESETAGTNKLEVQLPADTPFTSVRVKPIEGWTAEVVSGELPEPVTTPDGATVTVAPLSVVWTAEAGNEISQQEYQTFAISVGRLPESGTVVTLPAVQSYTDGSVRAWDEPAVEGGEEPESPAPAFTTTAAEGEGAHGAAPADTAGTEEEEAAASSTGTVDSEPAASTASDGSNAAGWAGLVAGLLGLAAGVTALVRTRRA
ncbi:YcnI family copper-binding membrane protein [Arthrobacter sp. H41]|uniref:YcnI family copper-binding membrane protein n=1 Tax=Arthrobacter sp. H41 TaxID=1312978 RepID=UPI00047DACE4|nr:YcnI family protein [Arthrobacter sp. H41]